MKARRVYFLSYIEWDKKADRGFDKCHSFEARVDSEAVLKANEHLKGKRLSGPAYLRVMEQRTVKYKTPRGC